MAFLLDPNDIRFFLLFGIFPVCLLKLLHSIFMRCNLLSNLNAKKLWQRRYSPSARELREKFSIKIYNIESKVVHLLTNTPGFLFPRFWRELFPLLLLLFTVFACTFKFSYAVCIIFELILLFVWLLLFWMKSEFHTALQSFA